MHIAVLPVAACSVKDGKDGSNTAQLSQCLQSRNWQWHELNSTTSALSVQLDIVHGVPQSYNMSVTNLAPTYT